MSDLSNQECLILKNIVNDHLIEKRRSRRWKIFFRFCFLIIFCFFMFILFGQKYLNTNNNLIAVVELNDTISKENNSYNNLLIGLKNAFKNHNVKAVIVKANSPGGSPVYSDLINHEIYQFKKDYPKVPLYFVIEDICASGCYYAAVAADKIYANSDSIVGSIGVISPNFGATELIKKLGIDSRLQIAGKYKSMGYPFEPDQQEYTLIRQQILDQVHQDFIKAVKMGRGKHLIANPDLFTGRYWLGGQALTLGLIDGIASVEDLARQNNNAKIVNYTVSPSSFDKFKKLTVSAFDASSYQLLSNHQFLL